MNKIAVVGYKGKMGSEVYECLRSSFCVIGIEKGDGLGLAADVELVIDFGGAQSSLESADWCKLNNKKLIIGSTGQTEMEIEKIKNVSKHIPLMMAGNFSIGILKLKEILNLFKESEIESVNIIEHHHKLKKDKPSGTAKEIGNLVKQKLKVNPKTLSLRNGEEIGTHEVEVYLNGEVLRITHQAFSRRCFARGVVLATKFMLMQKNVGIYTFDGVFV